MSASLLVLDWLFRVTWQSALLILLVLLVQRLLRRRLSAGWRHALWLVVLLRLALPLTFRSSISLFNLVPDRPLPDRLVAAVPALPGAGAVSEGRNPVLLPAPSVEGPGSAFVPQPFTLPTPPAEPSHVLPALPEKPFDGRVVLFRLWLAGVTGLAMVAGFLVVRARRRLAGATSVSDRRACAVLASCCRDLGLRRQPRLLEAAGLASPALCGFWRPRILLPAGFLARFSESEQRLVFLHELAHLRRGDLALNWIMTALQIVHWFNPLVWFAFTRMRADCELACDAMALSVAGETHRQAYGETILRLLADFGRPAAIPGLVGILEDQRRLAERLDHIVRFRKPSKWSALAGLLLVGLAAVGLTDPKAGGPEEPPARGEPKISVSSSRPPDEYARAANPASSEATAAPIPLTEFSAEGTPSDNRLWITITYEGKPVPGAEVRFTTRNHLGAIRLSGKGYTDPKGRTFVYQTVHPERLVIRHGKLAADVAWSGLTNGCEVVLQPAAVLEGTLWLGGKPWAGQRLNVVYPHWEGQPLSDQPLAVTDAKGRFRFPALPVGVAQVELTTLAPGVQSPTDSGAGSESFLVVGRTGRPENPPTRPYPSGSSVGFIGLLSSSTQLAEIELTGGHTNRLDLRLIGRRIQGRAVVKDTEPAWDHWFVEVHLRCSEPWGSRFGLSRKDGSFVVPYAPPGDYRLGIQLHDSEAGNYLGSGRIPLTVTPNRTEGSLPLDVGEVLVKLRPPKGERARATETSVAR